MQKWMVTKETKLKDVLKTPAGHDILAKAFYSLGLSEKILTATPLGSLKINSLVFPEQMDGAQAEKSAPSDAAP